MHVSGYVTKFKVAFIIL